MAARGSSWQSVRVVRAVGALLTARTIADAARDAGLSERTLHRMLADPEFQDVLHQAEADAINQAARNLASAAAPAVARLVALVDKAEAEAVQLRAADAVLSHALRLRELGTLEDRIIALENAHEDTEETS